MIPEIKTRHNPCQGCPSYRTRKGTFGLCRLEAARMCGSILLYDEAVRKGE